MANWDFSSLLANFGNPQYTMDGQVQPPTSANLGGVLQPNTPYPIDDDSLDMFFQVLVVAITGLAPTLVRPRWQPVVPKQPAPNVTWCAIGVMGSFSDDGPSIGYDPLNNVGPYTRHETLDILASFYGPQCKTYAAILRDGLAIPQNCDVLRANAMGFVECGRIVQMHEQVNQQWVKRQDMPITIRREVQRSYTIENIEVVEINLLDDTVVNDTIIIPPGSPWEP